MNQAKSPGQIEDRMSVIRFNTDEVFQTDSSEYEILVRAAQHCAQLKTPGGIVEIGTRRGGSALMIMQGFHGVEGASNRLFCCIDPYGNIEIDCTNKNLSIHYPQVELEGDKDSTDVTKAMRFDYTNGMRNRVIPSLYYVAYQAGFDFRFFCMTDYAFFNSFAGGVPTYDQEEVYVNEYAFVFFDGPHDNELVNLEVNFFLDRAVVGTVFVYDDIWMYDHDSIEELIFQNGFELLEKGNIKASYVKVT